MIPSLVRPLAVISGAHVHRALGGREKPIVELAEATYQLRAAGDTANARRTSCDGAPSLAVITRPASLGGKFDVDGPKVDRQLSGKLVPRTPRASAVLIVGNFFHDLHRYGRGPGARSHGKGGSRGGTSCRTAASS